VEPGGEGVEFRHRRGQPAGQGQGRAWTAGQEKQNAQGLGPNQAA
jgi:hypothetical protein